MFITELRFKKLNKGIIKYCNKLDTYLLEHLTAAWCYFSEQRFFINTQLKCIPKTMKIYNTIKYETFFSKFVIEKLVTFTKTFL